MQLHHLNALSNNSSLPHFLHLFPSFSSFSLLLQFLSPLSSSFSPLTFSLQTKLFPITTLIKLSILSTYNQLFSISSFLKSFSLLCLKGSLFWQQVLPQSRSKYSSSSTYTYRFQQSPSTVTLSESKKKPNL